jgi:photosystem II stability/assembly factor-like uncharacterized protein
LALDEPAIAVGHPANVMLDAITQAGNRLLAAGEHGVVIYSDNDGSSWTQAAVPVDVTLTAIAFADARSGWAVGNSGVILHTDDGGLNWRLQLNGLQADQITLQAAKAAVALNNPSPGTKLAVARANHLIAQNDPKPFLSLIVFNQSSALALGAYRLAMMTTDGGRSWTDWSLNFGDPLSHHLYGVAPVGGDIYVVGEAGLVFRSTDGGKTFPAVAPAGASTLFGVLGTGDGGVMVYGVAGALYRSADGGQHWTAVTMPPSANLTDAVMLKSGAIVVTAESGIIYVSQDHGKSFTPDPERAPMAVFGVAQAADGTVVVTGGSGVMRLSF